MKHITPLIAFLVIGAAATAQEPVVSHAEQQAAASAPESASEPEPSALSSPPGQLVIRVGQAARHQAEAEVHHETQRRVHKLFGRLLRR